MVNSFTLRALFIYCRRRELSGGIDHFMDQLPLTLIFKRVVQLFNLSMVNSFTLHQREHVSNGKRLHQPVVGGCNTLNYDLEDIVLRSRSVVFYALGVCLCCCALYGSSSRPWEWVFIHFSITIHWIGVVIYMSQRVVRKFRDSLFYSPLAGLRIPLIITKLKLNRSRNPYTLFDQ